MKLVAVEEHVLPPEVRRAWADPSSAPNPTAGVDEGEIGARLEDMGDGRIALMDKMGVDVQVLSLTTPGLHDLAAEPSVTLARRVNDGLAEAVSRHPDRFQGFAALPTPAPEAAPRELERAVRELGLKGALLCGRTRARHLDHPAYAPMLACAAELGAPLFLHPQVAPPAVRAASYADLGDPRMELALAAFGLGWHYEAGLAFVRLVLAGVFDRLPTLQVILGHWGELVLFYLERLAVFDRVGGLERPFAEYVRRHVHLTASGMYSAEYLRRGLDLVGPERLLFSTDYPYQYRPGGGARRFLEEAPLDAAARAGFAHANWERLTSRLPGSDAAPSTSAVTGPA